MSILTDQLKERNALIPILLSEHKNMEAYQLNSLNIIDLQQLMMTIHSGIVENNMRERIVLTSRLVLEAGRVSDAFRLNMFSVKT